MVLHRITLHNSCNIWTNTQHSTTYIDQAVKPFYGLLKPVGLSPGRCYSMVCETFMNFRNRTVFFKRSALSLFEERNYIPM